MENLNVIDEIRYTADSGNSTIIPINKNWKTLGILVSGGLDSTLLLYLTAKTIKNLNYDLKILPICFEIPSKLIKIDLARNIINKIQEILDVDFILPIKEFHIPLNQCSHEAIETFDGKNKFMKQSVRKLINNKEIDFLFNGITKNPPEHIRKHFYNDANREKTRDTKTSIYNSKFLASPHAFVDKADIVNLYIKEQILKNLAVLTLSCDAFINKIIHKHWNIPCKNCWWCHEREYGFRANGVEDMSEIKIDINNYIKNN